MNLDTYILTAQELRRHQLQLSNFRMIKIRWAYVALIAAVGISVQILNDARPADTIMRILVVGVVLSLNSVLWLLTRRNTQSLLSLRLITFAQIVLDVSLASLVVYVQGPRVIILYAIPIIISGILFSRSVVNLTAGLCSLAYVAITLLLINDQATINFYADLVLPFVFYSSLFFIIALIVSHLNEANVRSTRQESYDELLAMLTHQLRHPSSAIAAIIDVMENNPDYKNVPEQYRQNLSSVKKENARSINLISNLIESAKLHVDTEESPQQETIDVTELVRDCAEMSATSIRRKSDLKLNLPTTGKATLKGYADQLRMALDNIINNAFLYSPKGTPVIVTVGTTPTTVTVSVEDEGRGMTKEQQRRLFKRFTEPAFDKKSNSPPKAGLGLYVSKRIIERHSGNLAIASRARQGTKVVLNFKKGGNDE